MSLEDSIGGDMENGAFKGRVILQEVSNGKETQLLSSTSGRPHQRPGMTPKKKENSYEGGQFFPSKGSKKLRVRTTETRQEMRTLAL